MSLDVLQRKNEMRAPALVKEGVVLGGFVLVGAANQLLLSAVKQGSLSPVSMLAPIITLVGQVSALIALWNMRRWAVVVLGVLAIVSMLFATALESGTRGFFAGMIVRALPLVPGLLYWRRMSW